MSDQRGQKRLLFVHAHPDDETLATGLAMVAAARSGHEVHLLTCTLGDEGEVIPPELAHLAVDRDDILGPYRRGELRAAMARLGVHEVVLGEDPATQEGARYRDSGMIGTGANGDPRALCQAPLDAVAADIGAHIAALAPDVVVTYDEHGGYGHPDHIRVHDATCRALAQLPAHERPTLFGAFTPLSWAQEDRAWVREHVQAEPPIVVPAADADYPPSVVPDEVVTHVVTPDAAAVQARDDALREHRTQVSVFDGFYTLSNDIAARLTRREGYAVLDPATGLPLAADHDGVVEGLLGPEHATVAASDEPAQERA